MDRETILWLDRWIDGLEDGYIDIESQTQIIIVMNEEYSGSV